MKNTEMKDLKNISKRMPFTESEDYLDNLISEVTEKAVNEGHRAGSGNMGDRIDEAFGGIRRRIFWPVVSVAAAAAVLLVFILAGKDRQEPEPSVQIAQVTESPVDAFLDGLSDEDLMELSSYETEDLSYLDYEDY